MTGSSNTLMSRLDDKETGAIIVVMQRVHMDDLCGFLMSDSHDWEVLSLPAIAEAEARIQIGDERVLSPASRRGACIRRTSRSRPCCRLSRSIGSDVFAAQYQQSPVPAGGAMIKRDWLRYYENMSCPSAPSEQRS